MRLTIRKELLAAPLSVVAHAADNRASLPVLGAVLMRATNSELSMVCSDTGVLAKASTGCAIKEEGETAVDVRRLYDLVRAVPDAQDIELTLDAPNLLAVKAGRSRFKLPAHAADAYPKLTPSKCERVGVTLSGKRVADMLDQIAGSMAINDTRIFLQGALLRLGEGHLWLVSTDGHRMTVTREPVAGLDAAKPVQVVLPRKSILVARRLMANHEQITLTVGNEDAAFQFDKTMLFAKGLDGHWPDWKRAIPAGVFDTELAAARLAEAVGMIDASLVAKDSKSVRAIELAFQPGMLALVADESARCELDAKTPDATSREIAVNLDYLRDAVTTIAAGADTLALSVAANNALLLRQKGQEYPLVVLMGYRK